MTLFSDLFAIYLLCFLTSNNGNFFLQSKRKVMCNGYNASIIGTTQGMMAESIGAIEG